TTAPVTRLEATPRTDPPLSPRRERVSESPWHPLTLALPPGPPVRLPRRRPGASRVLPAGGIRHGDVRRELELARAGVDAGQYSHHPRAPEPLCLLWRRLHRRVPDRLRQADDALRDRPPDRAAAHCHLSQGRERPPSGLRRCREVPGRPALAGSHSVLRVLPRRQRRR